ncbi:MAG: hypothetical protein V3U74_04115 [Thermodesulfobacteriota bacterium]
MSAELLIIIIVVALLVVFGLILFLTNVTDAGHEASPGEQAEGSAQPPGGDVSVTTGSEFQSSAAPQETAQAETEGAPEEPPQEQGAGEAGGEFQSPVKR